MILFRDLVFINCLLLYTRVCSIKHRPTVLNALTCVCVCVCRSVGRSVRLPACLFAYWLGFLFGRHLFSINSNEEDNRFCSRLVAACSHLTHTTFFSLSLSLLPTLYCDTYMRHIRESTSCLANQSRVQLTALFMSFWTQTANLNRQPAVNRASKPIRLNSFQLSCVTLIECNLAPALHTPVQYIKTCFLFF